MQVLWKRLPRVDYKTGLKIQELIHKTEQNVLLLLEHPPTFTAGRRIKGDLQEFDRLKQLGAQVYETGRGGQYTFHGPGQLVGYPILNLNELGMGVREYVSGLEKLLIDACSQVQVQAKTTGCTGVWVNDAKIAALGIQVQRHRTMHGFALNCNTDLKWFEQFACGLPNPTTSLSKEAGIDITVDQMAPIITRSFEKQFKIEARELSKIDPSLDYEIQSLL